MNKYKRILALIIGIPVAFFLLSLGITGWTLLFGGWMFFIGIYVLINLAKFQAIIAQYEDPEENEVQVKVQLARKHKGYKGDMKYLQLADEKMKERKPVEYAVFNEKKAK